MHQPKLLTESDVEYRLSQAKDLTTPPEILHKLANDPHDDVRMQVAEHPAAPLKTQLLLALDGQENVRTAMARRADALVAKLALKGVPHAAALALHTLEALALDQAVNVRIALSSSLKDVALAPPEVVKRLAQDLTRAVAEPILRYCLALSDDDLVELIAKRHEAWSRSAIAARPKVSTRVSDAIIASNDSAAIITLINNKGAELSDAGMTQLTERAATEISWQEPLATRHDLPPVLARRLAEFVDEKILCLLRQRDDFDTATAQDIVVTVRRRVDWASAPDASLPGAEKARRLFLCDKLGETEISDALSWDEQEFVRHAVALLARVPEPVVDDIFKSISPKAVTALAWRARLSMRCALLLQMRAGNIPANRLLNARGGTEYPLTEVAMIWQLELFGVSAA
ncbi:MAG: DUF2336 domain-containing protein [Alphaproteobacteria bacterium]